VAEDTRVAVLLDERDLFEGGEFVNHVGRQLDRHRIEALEVAFDVDAAAVEQRVQTARRFFVELEDDRDLLAAVARAAHALAQLGRHLVGQLLPGVGGVVLPLREARRAGERAGRERQQEEQRDGSSGSSARMTVGGDHAFSPSGTPTAVSRRLGGRDLGW
jgi:hypothetical protein